MSEVLSFPGLGLQFNVHRVAFTIGNIEISWYGLLISLGFLVGLMYVLRRAKGYGLYTDRVIDVIIGGLIGGIIGARAYFVAFKWELYKDNPISVFKTWEGGIAIYGGLIGAVLVGALVARWRQVKLTPMLDLAAGGLIIGQAIGRWGNFTNIEAFGSNTTLPWGMTSPSIQYYLTQNLADLSKYGVSVDPNIPVHPTFLYESLWCLVGFLLIRFFAHKRKYDGEVFLFYATYYSLGRFFIEGLRTDSLMLGNLRVSQLLAILLVLVGIALLLYFRSAIKRGTRPSLSILYADTEDSRLRLSNNGVLPKDTSEETPPAGDTPAGDTSEDDTEETASDEAPETEDNETDEPKESSADTSPETTSEETIKDDLPDDNKESSGGNQE